MTITSTAPVLTSTGITAPTYADILSFLQIQYQTIFGADVYLGNDSQDGQWLAIIAKAISDANSAAIAVYNSFSPATGQGNSLASNVKLNGIARNVASNSTANLTIIGQAGTAITNGVVQDIFGNKWMLPTTVNIPTGGSISVTATAITQGAITASPNTITQIITPQLGWQTATNPLAAVVGAPAETDAALRKRQAISAGLPAQTVLGGILSAVAALPGVTRYIAYENPTGTTDSNGLPPHSISIVVEGGSTSSIATAIANKKTIGANTYGTTSQSIVDAFGVARTVNFFIVSPQRISVAISLHAISGYTAAIGVEIQNAIANYINSIPIGNNVFLSRVYGPAILCISGNTDGNTYEITNLAMSIYPATPVAADVVIAFNQVAHCNPSDVVITLV